MLRSRRAALGVGAMALATAHCRRRADAGGVIIAAASSLAGAFDALATAFASTGRKPARMNYGASDALARQLRAGAPFDALASADAALAHSLERAGLLEPGSSITFARATLVLFVARPQGPLPDLAALREPSVGRIAIADPDSAPLGRAAREALERAGLWSALAPKLVRAASARQSAMLVTVGEADAALCDRGSAAAHPGRFREIARETYAPLHEVYGVVARSTRRADAHAFGQFLRSPRARAVLRANGLEPT